MGRPLNKKYFGNRNVGTDGTYSSADAGLGGQTITSITLGGTNNSTGFTNGSTTQATIAAPDLSGESAVTATATIVTYAAGALTNATTYGTYTGTGVSAAGTFTAVAQKSTNGSGTGATFNVAKTSGTAYSSTITVTLASAGSGYVSGNTITLDGANLGGVTSTNDLTFTIGTFVATTGTISSITVTNGGDGYTTVPTVTLSTGTKGTLTVTAVLSTDNTATVPGSLTNRENAIQVTANVTGTARAKSDIIKQVSGRRYKVENQDGAGIVALVAATPSTAGQATINATDASSGTYYVTKLTAHLAVVTQNTGTTFTTGTAVPWTFTSPAPTGYVTIDNG
jgi:hypothetical protein